MVEWWIGRIVNESTSQPVSQSTIQLFHYLTIKPIDDIWHHDNQRSRYLKLHEITICKYAAEGQSPAIRIGRVWRFDKDVIDGWISAGQNEKKAAGRSQRKGGKEKSRKKKTRKRKV